MNKLKEIILKWLFSYDVEIIVGENAHIPFRAYKTDAGYDLYVSKKVVIPSHSSRNVPTDIRIVSKRPVWFLLVNRSSTLKKYNMLVNLSVIDHQYTGEMFVTIYNLDSRRKVLFAGMRVAQIIAIPHTTAKFIEVDRFDVKSNERGERGFGSSGA